MNPSYIMDFVNSKDGTQIAYRKMGQGPGVILLPGGMQAAQNFMRLAEALADIFTVYIPDRRGRGLSGPYGDDYCIQKAVDDMQALLNKTGASNVFGLSAGAVISLQSALLLPEIRKLALYEPPLSINASAPTAWLARYDREIAEGNLAAAMVTVMKGTGDVSLITRLPRFMSEPLLKLGIKAEAQDVKDGDIPILKLIPTMHEDVEMVNEMNNTLQTFRNVQAEVLLLGGSKSARYLKFALDQLQTVLPHMQRIEFKGFDHLAANNGGKPEQVAAELRKFFQAE